ncbi:NADH:flavin oxidoreductase [Halobaculum sp. EA56]|uniref:oxidoreductase n=1 Tax=Halobaculum sp. EA56 TaxID=3421648 RepID=UPI003EBE913E
MRDDPLFESFELNGLPLDNRVGLAPMTRTSATDEGHATERMARYYASFARGGFSFLLTEGVHPDATHSQGYPNQPGLATDDQADSWAQVVDAVHAEGSPIFAQLMHAGAQAQGNRYGRGPVSPSAYRPPGEMSELYGGSGEFPEAEALDADGLAEVKAGFVAAAERAVDAGFDGVEVHAANGYLLHEFVDPLVNDRDDEYGGSPENRARFPAEVTAAIDEATPDGFVVGVRASQGAVTDEERVWPDGEATAAALFGALSDAGADYVHVTGGDATVPEVPDTDRTLAELALEHAVEDVAVIANGSLGDPENARAALADGADLITLGTGALANHDWPDRVRADEPLDDLDPSVVFEPDASLSDAEVPAPGDD